MTDLDPNFTFENFVVGPANRLASAAARRAAESPGSSYNPLFLYSPSGLGKSHILGAIAHQVERLEGKRRIHYQTLEGYLDDLAGAIERGDGDRLRDELEELDLLLLDDVQFLAGQPEAQEMILTAMDRLTRAGSQVVLASDRPPSEINGLDARLVSRFSGGLIVDIAPPEFETRVAIIRRKMEDSPQTLEPGVAEALARIPFRNVRELGGALIRILAVQELEERRLSAEDVPGLVGLPPEREGRRPVMDEALGNFLSEVTGELADRVEPDEEPWRRELREEAETAETEGFSAGRLREMAREDSKPSDWSERLESFRQGLARLREISAELDRLRNPWPEAAATLVKDPDRLDEAEAFLVSVQERTRPFPRLAPGPDLKALSAHLPALAVKAAEQLASADKPQYNPLYIWGQEVEAAHAVLAGTARTFTGHFPRDTVAVTSVANFSEDFIRALSEGVAGAWRERWWTVDLLLVYEAQSLSDTERAQDEFFHLFEALKRRGARVLLAADRPPAEIRGIDERLRSRFEGGLVLEMESVSLPQEATALEFVQVDVDDPMVDSGWEGLARDVEEPESPDEAAAGAAGPEGGQRGVGKGRAPAWLPSRENVVWVWPRMDERLVEELE